MSSGVCSKTMQYTKSEYFKISAQEGETISISNSILSTPVMDHFTIVKTQPGAAVRNVNFDLTITAIGSDGETFTSYSGTLDLSLSAGNGTLTTVSKGSFSNGIATYTVKHDTAETIKIHGTDNKTYDEDTQYTGDSENIEIIDGCSGTLDHFTVEKVESGDAGLYQTFTVKITAIDTNGCAYDYQTNNSSDTVTIERGDKGSGTLKKSDDTTPITINGSDFSSSQATVSVKYDTVETFNIKANDNNSITGTSADINCVPIMDHFKVEKTTSQKVTVDVPFGVTVTAIGNDGNTYTSYSGSVTLSRGSGTGILSGGLTIVTFTNGVGQTTNTTYDTAEWFSIKATDGTYNGESDPIEAVYDADPPQTTASPNGGAFSSSQGVTLSCVDIGSSGCRRIVYTTDGTKPSFDPVNGTIVNGDSASLTIGEGNTVLLYRSEDYAGNVENIKKANFTISNQGFLYAITSAGISRAIGALPDSSQNPVFVSVGSKEPRDIVYKNGKLFIATGYGLFVSEDGGNHFKHYTVVHGLPSDDVNKIVIENDYWYIATSNGIAIYDVANDEFSIMTDSNINGKNVTMLYKYGDTLYAGVYEVGAYKTSGDPITKNNVFTDVGIGTTEYNRRFTDMDADGSILAISVYASGIYLSTDGGSTWTLKSPTFPAGYLTSVTIDNNKVYGGNGSTSSPYHISVYDIDSDSWSYIDISDFSSKSAKEMTRFFRPETKSKDLMNLPVGVKNSMVPFSARG